MVFQKVHSNLDRSAETGYSGSFRLVFSNHVCMRSIDRFGAVAERIKIWPFFIFAAIMAGIIHPISMGWQWGGWLASSGFSILLDQH